MSVFGMMSAIAGFLKVNYLIDKAIIDNMIFRCHYRLTSVLLFACCLIVSGSNLIDYPIICLADEEHVTHVIDTYCWITSTFTLPRRDVENEISMLGYEDDEDIKTFHNYYQWVPFFLFFQGLMFYAPHWIWKKWEGGKIQMITAGLRGFWTTSAKEKRQLEKRLAKYLYKSLHTHNLYAFGYFFCEFLNLCNVALNIVIVDKFLGGSFITYGVDVIKHSYMNQDIRTDPMIEIFPRMTKCTFHHYGPTGSIMTIDALCVLALNMMNEKIYVFLWFWFLFLALLSIIAIVYSLIILVLPAARKFLIRRRFYRAPQEIDQLFRFINFGDFLILDFLGKNVVNESFCEIVTSLCKHIQKISPSNDSDNESSIESNYSFESETESGSNSYANLPMEMEEL